MNIAAVEPAPTEMILAVDDDPSILRAVESVLTSSGFGVATTTSAHEAVRLVESTPFALVLADLSMPEMSGLELISAIHAVRPSLPIVICSGHGDADHLSEALNLGAAGFISKPFRPSDLRSRVRAALNRTLLSEAELRERLVAPSVATALANAVEVRDQSMEGHTERLSALAIAIGRRVGLPAEELDVLQIGAVLHDVGKIGVPDGILLRPGPITADERVVIETHTVIGDQMLVPLGLLEAVRPVVRHHHERWDGGGYPDGLRGDEIPLLARIVSVADSVEAMSGNRLYRAPLGRADVVRELSQGRGRQWDPDLVDIVLGLIDSGQLGFGPAGIHIAPAKD